MPKLHRKTALSDAIRLLLKGTFQTEPGIGSIVYLPKADVYAVMRTEEYESTRERPDRLHVLTLRGLPANATKLLKMQTARLLEEFQEPIVAFAQRLLMYRSTGSAVAGGVPDAAYQPPTE